jgi:hypothetical protein
MKDGFLTTCNHCGETIRWTKTPSGLAPILESDFSDRLFQWPERIAELSHAQWNEWRSTAYQHLDALHLFGGGNLYHE